MKKIIKIILIVLPLCFFVIFHQCHIPEQEEKAWEVILFVGLIGMYALECIVLGIGIMIRKIIQVLQGTDNRKDKKGKKKVFRLGKSAG